MTAEHNDAADGQTESADHTAVPDAAHQRRRFWWVRWAALALVIIILTVEAVLVWPKLEEAWRSMDSLNWLWILACIVAAGFSMDSFAQVQRTLLRSAGVKVKQLKSLSVVLAANSVSQTMPGGNVLAPAFTYRQTRRWGASPVVASWQVVMSGLLMGVGLAVLGLGGALLAGAKTSPFSVIFSISGFLAFVIAAQYVAGHPESIQGIGTRLLHLVNHFRDKPQEHGVERWHEILDQLRAVQLDGPHTALAFGWSLFNWVADVACLAFACYAVGGETVHLGSGGGLRRGQGRRNSLPAPSRWPRRRRRRSGARAHVGGYGRRRGRHRSARLPLHQLPARRPGRLGGHLLHVPPHHRSRHRSRGRHRPDGDRLARR